MPCRIFTAEDEIEPLSWAPYKSVPGSACPQLNQAGGRELPPLQVAAEVLALKQRIQQLEQARSMEALRGKQEGIAEGLERGRSEIAAQITAVNDRLTATLAELTSLKRKLRNEAEREILDLSLAIARRILYRELATDPDALQGVLHIALQKLQNREISRIRVYPEGADAIRAGLHRIGAAPAIQVFSDASLRAGSLIFETSLGELDASIDTQLAEIQRGFADRLSS